MKITVKKLAAGAILVGLCLVQEARRSEAQSSCFTTINQGAATVPLGAYEQSCASVSWTSGTITKDVTYNCCVAAPTIRVNGNDWMTLLQAGKLDGFRYQKISKNDAGSYVLEFKKVVGTGVTLIDPTAFN